MARAAGELEARYQTVVAALAFLKHREGFQHHEVIRPIGAEGDAVGLGAARERDGVVDAERR